MDKKKVFKYIFIAIMVAIAIFCITKIFAAGTTYEDGEEWESTGWGYYEVTEDGEVIYSEEEYKCVDGTYTSAETVSEKLRTDGFYFDDLDKDGSIFCIEKGQQLPSRDDENKIRKMGSGSTKGDQYYNGSDVSGLNPNSTTSLNSKEQNALESRSGDSQHAIRGNFSYNYFKDGTYYSRSLKDQNGNYSAGKVTKYATKNDGTIQFSGGTPINITEYEEIPWEDAYVLANSDPLANTEENPAQLALWALGGLNIGEKAGEQNELYKKAMLFGQYKRTQEEKGKGGPELKDGDQDYKYRFNVQENYLIAGPINISYGDLTLTSDGVELEVRQIEKYTVYGLDGNGEIIDITDYVEFTDENGNALTDMETTSGTSEGDGAGKSFPKSDNDFYIKFDYNNPIYTEVKAINSLEVSFKELDVRAVGCKVSEVPVYYTEWVSNNIMWQKCKEVHNYSVLINGRYYSQTTTIDNGSHLKNDCSASKGGCTRGHTLCSVSIQHQDDTAKSEGVLLRGNTAKDGNAQELFILHKAELYWRRYKLVILFGPENTPETPDTPETPKTPDTPETPKTPDSETPESHRTYIDIGGIVWVDDVTSKEGNQDGLDGKYGTGEDYERPNVKVTLYFEDSGAMVQKEDVAEWAQAKFENPTWTKEETWEDENGKYNYMFYQLPMDKKYYVEFTYDGMMYTTTEFLATDGDTDAYEHDPNAEQYKTNSKAKEMDEDRETFNNRFAEIKGNKLISEGYTEGTTNDGSILKYKSETFDSETPQSRLLTTTNEEDVTENHATGIARPATDSKEAGKYNGEDYEMTVNTRDSGISSFPFGDDEITIWSEKNEDELEYLKHINLGLKRRTTADLRIAVDIKAGATTIKDKEKVVFYKSSAKMDDLTVDATDTTEEYVKQEIAATDYNWKAKLTEIYGDNPENVTGYAVDVDKLNVYVLYRIALANQCEEADYAGVVTGVVDYFDNRLEMVPDADIAKVSKLFAINGFEVPDNTISWIAEDKSKVEWEKGDSIGNYTTIKTKNLELKLDKSGDTKSIYLILKVKENGDVLYTGLENGKNGIENIAEITSYKILDENGKAAGLVDKDSAPYNATPGNKSTYEDDTDNAPMFQLIINLVPREIKGNVWDDISKDANMDSNESGIMNVKVELIEYCYDSDSETLIPVVRPGIEIEGENLTVGEKEIRTADDGSYQFYVEGGNYALRFTYGDNYMLQDASTKKYNAQDYYAAQPYTALSSMDAYNTPYSKAFATEADLVSYLKSVEKLEITDLDASEKGAQPKWESEHWKAVTDNTNSSARDLAEIRAQTIKNAIELTYTKADLLNELNPERTITDVNELTGYNNADSSKNYTFMQSVTDIVIIQSNDLVDTAKVINLGLQERENASVKLEKTVTRIVLTANDGTVLIDTADNAKQSNMAIVPDSDDPKEKFDEALMYLDSRAMDGATIDIDYTITVTNDAEENEYLINYVYADNDDISDTVIMKNLMDKLNSEPYCFGLDNLSSPLPIRANTIYDYVNINLEYRAADNGGEDAIWTKVYDEDDKDLEEDPNVQKWLEQNVYETLPRSNKLVSKVLSTNENAETTNPETGNLIAGEEKSIAVHLGISLAESTEGTAEDDFTYKNCAEIVQVYSAAGRRDYETIPGNYIPYDENEENKEEDGDTTGTTTVIPPTGENRAVYVVIPVISMAIIIVGIILIKKKVLKK